MNRNVTCILALAIALAATELNAQRSQRRRQRRDQNGQQELVVNGKLEKGRGRTPRGWAKFDGITQIWDKNGGYPRKCLLLDTSVLQLDKKRFQENEEEFKKRGPGKGGIYDVVGAHEGAWAFPAPIDVTPQDSYFILSADVSAPAKSTELFYPQILIRGFVPVTEEKPDDAPVWFHHHFGQDEGGYEDVFGAKKLIRKPRVGDWRMVYRHAMACRVVEPHKFRHVQMGFKLPSIKRFRPTRLLLKPYAIWPAGEYRFDNISLRRATRQEVQEVNANRPSINEIVPE